MSPLKSHKRSAGRPRQPGARYPCGKLKPAIRARRSRPKQSRETVDFPGIETAIALLGPLRHGWQTYPPETAIMAAARLLAEQGLACLAQRRTAFGIEYLVRPCGSRHVLYRIPPCDAIEG